MSESSVHRNLVASLAEWIADNYLQGAKNLLLIDSSLGQHGGHPPAMDGYVPDIYVELDFGRCVIVGEAKTRHDLERAHSLKQMEAFLKHCSRHEKSVFLLAVPWHMVPCARSLVGYLIKRFHVKNVDTGVLENLKG